MPELWVPEHKPPLLKPETKEKVVSMLLRHGIRELFRVGDEIFVEKQPLLRPYIKEFTFCGEDSADPKYQYAQKAFRIASVITAFAYYQDGFDEEITGDIFTIGLFDAELGGIPDTYVTSYYEDPELKPLLELVMETPDMQDYIEYGGYDDVMGLGAGVVRHYATHALAA